MTRKPAPSAAVAAAAFAAVLLVAGAASAAIPRRAAARGTVVAGAGPPAAGAGGWSAPRHLAGCVAAAAPQIAFPSASPTTPTGPGAIVWQGWTAGCHSGGGGAAGGPLSVSVAWLGADDGVSATDSEPLGRISSPAAPVAGAGLGRIAMAASMSDRTALLEGHGDGRLSAAGTLPGRSSRLALAHGYLGDVAVASVQAGPSIAVDVERYYRPSFARPLRIAIGAGAVTALTATMDYRSDVLVAWQQDGSIYAHMLRASGRAEPTQRVGASDPDPQLQALVSDDNHGMIAWSSTGARGRTGVKTTRVHLALSGTGVRFHGVRPIASYPDPGGAGGEPGALALVRLSGENVMLAWTEVEDGHYVALAAPAVFAGVRPATRLTSLAGQSVLAALAPGAANEAIAVWRRAVPHGSAVDWSRSQLWAARTFIVPHGHVVVQDPEVLGRTGSDAAPALAVDPADDRAVAAWLAPGREGGVTYAVGSAPPGYRRRAFTLPVAAVGAGVHWLRITVVAILVVAGALAGLTLRARRRARARATSP